MSKDKPLFDKYKVEGSVYLADLTKIVGAKVKRIEGYISREFGEPTFKLCSIVFENGEEILVEGEHDMPYVTPRGNTQDIIEQLAKESEDD